jgi:hypothetical protein
MPPRIRGLRFVVWSALFVTYAAALIRWAWTPSQARDPASATAKWAKPQGFKIVALIFCKHYQEAG